ncbi:SET domain-containing protein SmydA-8 [Drosophila busckii]|uniref:SET domain-containing protein SmydA-8 n=1 Tax=Drosophila busckii TaxID=30019 RepID=UPI00083F2465|nr:SET domain-containing protein SmydA-8 [Drosophila busckii]
MPARKHKKTKQQRQQKQQQKEQQIAKTKPQEHVEPQELQSAFRIEHSELMGRYLVANRELVAGELLISEEPLAIGPCETADPVCLGCYQPVSLAPQQYRCAGCGWPMCSAKCGGMQRPTGHTSAECAFYAEHRAQTAEQLNSKASPAEVRDLYELVLIIRIMLLQQLAPEQYKRIRQMESHTQQRRLNATLWQHYEKNVVQRLRADWQLAERWTAEELHEICGILDVNCFEIGQRGAKARTLYPSAFLLAHDCRPNTSHTDDPQSYAILLRTSRRVREQEPLTLSYAYTLQGSFKRRTFIQGGKLFWCQCQRCADPTELGTHCSDLACGKCKLGSIRATAPLEQLADWACDHCDYRLTASQVERLLDRINDDLEDIDARNVPALENFIIRYRDVLRSNHYLLLSAKYLLCQTYGRVEGYLLPQMSLEDIARKERYCREFLAIVDVLEPEMSRLRAIIMYELHAPIMVQAQLQMQSGQLTRQQFQRRIKEVMQLLRESSRILQLEPAGSAEHEMGLAAAEALREMDN